MNSQSPSSPPPLNLTKGGVISGGQLSGLKIQTKQERKDPHTWDLEGEETRIQDKMMKRYKWPLNMGSFNPSNTQNFLHFMLSIFSFCLTEKKSVSPSASPGEYLFFPTVCI